MNRKYLYRFGVKSFSKFSAEYTTDAEIGGGAQATIWSVSHKNASKNKSNTHSSSRKCIKLFKIDVTDFDKALKTFYKIIKLYHIIRSNQLSDYYEIYGNIDPSTAHKWTGIIILMKRYHHTLSDRQYYIKKSDLQQTEGNTMCNTNPIAISEENEGNIGTNPSQDEIIFKLRNGFVCGDHSLFVKKITTDLLHHLHSMHKAHIIHNDIKPDNIVFDLERGVWRFIDFDLSMIVQINGIEGLLLHSVYRGSVFYSAPEIRVNATKQKPNIYSKYADIFSLGMVISWLILNRNHIWYFVQCEKGERIKKEKYIEWYFTNLCQPNKQQYIIKCIKQHGMSRAMNECILQLLGFMLKIDFRERKNVAYLLQYIKTH